MKLTEKLLYEAEEENKAESQKLLGDIYFTGSLIEKDYEIARYWYEKAIANGYNKAYYSYAVMHQYGLGVEIDKEKAYKYYLYAIEADVKEAYYGAGLMVLRGYTKEKESKAILFFIRGASLNEDRCAYELGRIYEEGEMEPLDYDKAILYYSIAFENGIKNASINIGNIYQKKKEIESAEFYYNKAIDLKIDEGYYHLAMLYIELYDKEEKLKEAKKYLDNLNKNDKKVQYALGLLNKKLNNIDEYISYMEMSSTQEYELASFSLARFYELESIDLEKAYEYYLKAAQDGYEYAYVILGKWYNEGMYVEKDIHTAFNLFLKALLGKKKKNVEYFKEICAIDFTQSGIEKEIIVPFYKTGVLYKLKESAYYLGKIYEEGIITDVNLEEAYKWYNTAKSLGYDGLDSKLEELQEKINNK